MSVKQKHTFTRWTFTLHRDDEDDWPDELDQRYGVKSPKFRPIQMTLQFSRINDNPVTFDQVRLKGPRLLKDGSEGQLISDQWYFPPTWAWTDRAIMDALAEIGREINGPLGETDLLETDREAA